MDVRFVDCRPREAYLAGHVPGAVHSDPEVDLTGTDGTDMGDVWDWIDDHGAKYGLFRPMPGYDPAHIQAGGDWHRIAASLREGRTHTASTAAPRKAETQASVRSRRGRMM